MAYEFLAGCYDAFTADVHYARWADYLEKHFARSRLPIRTVLDLACGTGSLTRVLAERGYEMIGADLSQEMLAQAAEKCRGAGPIEPIFLHQAMEELDLYGTIDACVCCLDSVNYVTRPALLRKAFEGDWLPPEILWREKAAFSDAVGHSMVDDIKEYAESLYTDEEFQLRRANYSAHCMPFTKESLFYREIFEKYYHDQSRTIVGFWMPNKAWPNCNVNDPSARVLANYGASGV